jgi:hypothetical protein
MTDTLSDNCDKKLVYSITFNNNEVNTTIDTLGIDKMEKNERNFSDQNEYSVSDEYTDSEEDEEDKKDKDKDEEEKRTDTREFVVPTDHECEICKKKSVYKIRERNRYVSNKIFCVLCEVCVFCKENISNSKIICKLCFCETCGLVKTEKYFTQKQIDEYGLCSCPYNNYSNDYEDDNDCDYDDNIYYDENDSIS